MAICRGNRVFIRASEGVSDYRSGSRDFFTALSIYDSRTYLAASTSADSGLEPSLSWRPRHRAQAPSRSRAWTVLAAGEPSSIILRKAIPGRTV